MTETFSSLNLSPESDTVLNLKSLFDNHSSLKVFVSKKKGGKIITKNSCYLIHNLLSQKSFDNQFVLKHEDLFAMLIILKKYKVLIVSNKSHDLFDAPSRCKVYLDFLLKNKKFENLEEKLNEMNQLKSLEKTNIDTDQHIK